MTGQEDVFRFKSAERFRHLLHQVQQGGHMPKMKTKSGAAKRFKVRAGGSIKRSQAFKRHILTKKTTKNKRQLRGTTGVHKTNVDSIKAMMPYA
jgi:large subunit ribosomal protein L35